MTRPTPMHPAAPGLFALLSSAVLIVASPSVAAWLAGRDLGGLLELPPRPVSTAQPAFSAAAFIALAFALAVTLVILFAPPMARMLRAMCAAPTTDPRTSPLPWWGWAGLALTAIAWILAWSRFAWFAPLQKHTFTPLWIGYIVTVNALTLARTGRCLLVSRRRYFLALFPTSALFWWLFEFLNRFVGNWHYVDVAAFGPLEYTVLATLSFATVLPAVMSTAHYLASFPRLSNAFAQAPGVSWPAGRSVTVITLFAGCLALACVGAWPEVAFPLVWIAPSLVIFSLGALTGAETGLVRLTVGDPRVVFIPALSALLCGLLWEMWNYGSAARWEYTIPFVDRFHVFEMPVLGYAGYLPFGVCCFAVSAMIAPLDTGADDAGPTDHPLAPA